VKLEARGQAVELLEQHPGWSDREVARRVGVSPTTIGTWRREESLAPRLKSVGSRPRRGRIRIVPLAAVIVGAQRTGSTTLPSGLLHRDWT
jgi:hypothetical protein